MQAIQLHDKFTEEIIGTVLLKTNIDYNEVADAWDYYQETHNSNTENKPNIYDFVSKGNWEMFDVLTVEFYQPE